MLVRYIIIVVSFDLVYNNFNFCFAYEAMLWHLLVKKECPPEDPFICTFREKLDYLVEIHSQRVEFLES